MGFARASPRLILLAALAAGCAHSRAHADQRGSFHLVTPGETLFHIAQASGVPMATLQRENALTDPAQLKAGMRLFIPKVMKISPAPRAVARVSPQKPRAAARLQWPVDGVLFSPFGHRARDQHDGIDLAAPEGTPVRAADAGTVLFVGKQRGYGNLILIGHAGDLITVYAHNESNLVHTGDRVARGDLIARVGRSGNATGPHLHFEVRVSAKPEDPLPFLR